MTEDEYEAQIAERIDRAGCVEPFEWYTKEEMLELLELSSEKDSKKG